MASNANAELNAIKFILESKNPEVLIAVKPEYFGNSELQKIFLIIRNFYVQNSEFPGWDVLKSQIASKCATVEKRTFLSNLLDQVRDRDISGLTEPLMRQDLDEYYKFRLMLHKVQGLTKAVDDKDIDGALGKLKELHDSIFAESSKESLDAADMSSKAGKKITFNFLSTGIKPIDRRGGLIEGGYTIIAGQAKAGKSAMSGQIALHQYLTENVSVAYFSLEMQYEELRARLLSNFAEVDVGAMMDDSLSPTQKAHLRKKEAEFYCTGTENMVIDLDMSDQEFFDWVFANYPRRENKFYIFDDRLDWDQFWIKAELLATTKGVKVFVLDYPTLVNRGAAYKDLASWEYHLQQSKNLKTFAHKHKVCVITPAQLDPGKKGEDPRLKFVTNQINNCDLCLYLLNTEEDKALGTVTVKFGAYRNYKTLPDEPILQDFKLLKELHFSRFNYVEF